MGKSHQIGRILLPPIVIFEKKDNGFYASGKALPFILEDLIAKGIGEIVVIDPWRYEDVLKTLPRVFSKAIKISNSAAASSEMAAGIFAPFFEEFGIETTGHLSSFRPIEGSLAANPEHKSVANAGMEAACRLANYLAAQREKSHCYFDISSMIKRIEVVATASRSPDSRANMAVLKGLFSTYERVEHAAIKVQETSAVEITNLFDELLDDATYRSLSLETSKFGLRERGHDLKRNIGSLVQKIVGSNAGKRAIDFGSTIITASTGIPLPKSDLAEALLNSAYAPAVVDLSQSIESAKKKMIAAHPDIDFGRITLE